MNFLYKYLAYGFVVMLMLVGGFMVGHHEGSLAGTAEVNALRASIATQTASASQKAAQVQQQADAVALAQAEAAVQAANAAAAARANDLQSAHAALSRLKSEVYAYAKGTPENKWLTEPIPGDIVSRMCLYTGRPTAFNRACAGNTVPPDSSGRP